jgi:hypothetical protein
MLHIACFYYAGCASHDVLPDRLEQALRAENVQAEVEHRVISIEEGERLGMRGSPTVLISGVDILAGGAEGAT